jgi:hypothetical protein
MPARVIVSALARTAACEHSALKFAVLESLIAFFQSPYW